MKSQFVKVVFDVHCQWSDAPPRYRCYVEDELFGERTWVWQGVYLEEAFQIQAPPGRYKIRYELLDPEKSQLRLRNGRVEVGSAVLHKGDVLEIINENS
jgi:hypothetical protein